MDRCTTKRGRDPSRINNSSSSSSSSSSSYKLLSIPNFLSSARLPQSFTSLVCLIGTDGSRTVSTSFGKATTTESLNSPAEERWSSRRLEMKISVSCIHPLIFGRHFMSSFFLSMSQFRAISMFRIQRVGNGHIELGFCPKIGSQFF